MTTLWIRNGTLIDGMGGDPVKNAAVVVQDNVIHAAGRSDAILRPAGDVIEVDAQGGFILPGMIDTHVHVMFEIDDMREAIVRPF
ncbi:MAG: amidohydrolase family protein, partial [Anaerolineae bacterium]|nr:amidohydrolase family protein [Anaerolineae bacterium]